jgi:hypothetical protein
LALLRASGVIDLHQARIHQPGLMEVTTLLHFDVALKIAREQQQLVGGFVESPLAFNR